MARRSVPSGFCSASWLQGESSRAPWGLGFLLGAAEPGAVLPLISVFPDPEFTQLLFLLLLFSPFFLIFLLENRAVLYF